MAAAAGKWIQDQLLGMQWLKEAVGKALGFLGVIWSPAWGEASSSSSTM